MGSPREMSMKAITSSKATSRKRPPSGCGAGAGGGGGGGAGSGGGPGSFARVGQAVNLAVERFVTVGETIADDHPEVRQGMYEACKEARQAGGAIEHICEEHEDEVLPDRTTLVRASRCLLSAITRVLLLADIVVSHSLDRLESVNNFTEFVKAFSQFGGEMVELAHLTGDRQNDLKDERRRAQMAAARQVLERSTMMLLTSSKMRRAMDLVHYVVKDGVLSNGDGAAPPETESDRGTAYACMRRLMVVLEHTKMAMDPSCQDTLPAALEAVLERTQDFTDSAYTSHEHREAILESSERLKSEMDHLLGLYANIVCKLLRHVAVSETLQVSAKFTEINLRVYGPQVVTAAKALAAHPSSKISRENLEVFADMHQWLVQDVTNVVRDVLEASQASRPEKQITLSAPIFQKHGTTSKPLKAVRLDTEEQEKIAKSGLEMKLITSEMDAETEKWQESNSNAQLEVNEENNDIVKRAKNMSAMAFSMYQFTKGEGELKTTQDLFTQAEYFAEEANRLYKVIRQFSYQVPGGAPKKELLANLDKVPTYVQRLQFTVKDHTVGKAATFTKVDNVIQETKNLMNVISKVVTTCFECATKYNLALPKRVRFPCASLDGKLLPVQLSPQALDRIAKSRSATLPR
nr:unnamed protein product [Callosobruchus chinensis]